ncbi:MAG: hypothetical protein LBE21_01130, partial [Pseudomonadales bacterium]|nr:hypothetical protein [Pseudomonadales bacterium]
GAWFIDLQPRDLIVTATDLAVDDPLRLCLRKRGPKPEERLHDLCRLAPALRYDAVQYEALAQAYLRAAALPGPRQWRARLAAAEGSDDNAPYHSQKPPSA